MNTDSATPKCYPPKVRTRAKGSSDLEERARMVDSYSLFDDIDIPCVQYLEFIRSCILFMTLTFRFRCGFDAETTKIIMRWILHNAYFELVSYNPKYLAIVPPAFANVEICVVAAKQDIKALWELPCELKNKNFITHVVRAIGFNKHIPREWRSEETYLIGIKAGFDVIESMEDHEFTQAICDLAFETNMFAFSYFPEQFRTQEMYNSLFSKHVVAFHHIPRQFIDEGIIQQYMLNGGDLSEIPAEILTKSICENVVEAIPRAIMTVPENFLTENMIVNAVYGGVNCLNRIKSYHFTEKVCIALLASLGLHQKDLPRAFQTTDFAQRALSRKINPTALMFSF